MAEFAIALPLFVVLMMGVIDMSLYGWHWTSTVKATQIGVREAVVRTPMAAGVTFAWPTQSEADMGRPCTTTTGASSGLCPEFTRTCTGGGCLAGFDRMLAAMRRAQPRLLPEHVTVTYATAGLGFVGGAGGAPVVVTVAVRCFTFNMFFLDAWFRWSTALPASCPAGASRGAFIEAASSLTSEALSWPATSN